MMSDILGPWRRFWGLPWLWKGPVFGVAAAVVVAIGIVMASGGGDGGAGNAAGARFTQGSPRATASTSPGATTSPSVTPSGEAGTPTPEATEPGQTPEATPPPEGVVTPPPAPPESEGPAVPLIPAPSPPPPPPGLSPEDQATLAQFDYCSQAWWTGARLELQLGLMSKLSGSYDTTQFQQTLQQITDYLNQNCVGIGARAGAIPGIGAVRCASVRSSANILKMWGTMSQSLGGGTASLDFATKELQAFEAAAGCPAST